MFVVFSGVSSSGKNTIINELVKKRKSIKLLERSSGTTRVPRESDREFNSYVYMDKEMFKKGIEAGMFYEYEIVHGNYYGTFLAKLEKVKNDKKTIYVRDIDVKGMESLKKFFGEDEMLTIFLDVPDSVLKQRLKERGESLSEIKLRLSRGELERSYKDKYDLVVENLDIKKTVKEILTFIDSKTKKSKK